jgi:methane monooxygenase PmoA-like
MSRRSSVHLMSLLAALAAALPLAARADRVQVIRHDDQRRVDINIDGRPFTSYIYPAAHVTKPILYPLRSARGTVVTRGFPLEPRPGESTDHPHQVGAWFTYGNVNGIDFWGYSDETPAAQIQKKGTIRQRSITRAASGNDRGELAVTAEWVMPDGSTIMNEETRFVFRGDSDSRIVDRATRWTAAGTRVVFTDTKEGAFGIRVAKSLEQPGGTYHSSEGKTSDAVWGTRAKWMALTGTVDGENLVLAICDHPSNPGYPTYWHARGYGLFAANPFGAADFTKGKERMDFTLDAGKSVEFHHRILIVSGTGSLDRVSASCSEFAAGFPAPR